MAIWTSRYSNKELQNDKYYPVGISIGLPRFRLGYGLREQCYSLAPKRYMLNMELEPFKKAYYEKLAGIGEQKIINTVRRMEETARREGKELVLLCFEDIRIPEDWCHRTVFAEWWMSRTGERIKELPDTCLRQGSGPKTVASYLDGTVPFLCNITFGYQITRVYTKWIQEKLLVLDKKEKG